MSHPAYVRMPSHSSDGVERSFSRARRERLRSAPDSAFCHIQLEDSDRDMAGVIVTRMCGHSATTPAAESSTFVVSLRELQCNMQAGGLGG